MPGLSPTLSPNGSQASRPRMARVLRAVDHYSLLVALADRGEVRLYGERLSVWDAARVEGLTTRARVPNRRLANVYHLSGGAQLNGGPYSGREVWY